MPETIGVLRRAGCKIWMLTGDKYSTAIQIASSCNLIPAGAEANLLTVSGVSAEDIKRSVEDCLRRAQEMKAERKVWNDSLFYVSLLHSSRKQLIFPFIADWQRYH